METEVVTDNNHLDFKVKQLIHLFEKRCYTKAGDATDSPQSHETKRRHSEDISKTTVLIVKTISVDEDKKKKPAKEKSLIRKIDSLSDHERDSDEDTKPTHDHVHSSVATHVNNGVTHVKSSADEKTTRFADDKRRSADDKRRLDDMEEQLKITRIENERLRTQLSSLDKKFAVRETEDLRSKKDHDDQLKHWMTSANKQLEETNKHKQNYEKAKEELGRAKNELERHDKAKSEHERSSKESSAKVAELSKQLTEKEKLIVALREKHENDNDSKTNGELEAERSLRLKLTEELEEANRKIRSLSNQVELNEKAAEAHKRSTQELNSETRLRKKQEKLLEEAKEMVSTLGKQIEDKDRQLKAEKEKIRRSNSQELEQARKLQQDDAKSKLISVTQKLEETARELEHSKLELSKEKAQNKNQETLLVEANRKISELSRQLNEKDGEITAIRLEHDKVRRRHSSNPFETQSSLEAHVVMRSPTNPFAAYHNDDSTAVLLPDIPNTGPLINLHTGVERPRRKKNHPSRIPSTYEQSGGDDSDLSS